MAAAKDRSIFGTGSDFIDEHTISCQPCSDQGKNKRADKFCRDCQDFLCQECSTYHASLKLTKTHVLVPAKQAGKAPTVTTQDKCSYKCPTHKDMDIKFYCFPHLELACSDCIALNHKQCPKPDYIPEAAADIKNNQDFKQFHEQLKRLETACKSAISDVEKTVKLLEADERKVKEAIKLFKEEMIQAVDQLETKLTKKAREINREERKKLDGLSKKLAASLGDVSALVGKVDKLLSQGRNCDTYVAMRREAGQLESLKNELIRSTRNHSYRRYEFHHNKDVLKVDTLGTLTMTDTAVFGSSVTALSSRSDQPVKARQPQERKKLDGPAMAKMMKKGTRVRRGEDWNRGDEDGGGLGTVTGSVPSWGPGWYWVRWDCGGICVCRMGAEGAYDLEVV